MQAFGVGEAWSARRSGWPWIAAAAVLCAIALTGPSSAVAKPDHEGDEGHGSSAAVARDGGESGDERHFERDRGQGGDGNGQQGGAQEDGRGGSGDGGEGQSPENVQSHGEGQGRGKQQSGGKGPARGTEEGGGQGHGNGREHGQTGGEGWEGDSPRGSGVGRFSPQASSHPRVTTTGAPVGSLQASSTSPPFATTVPAPVPASSPATGPGSAPVTPVTASPSRPAIPARPHRGKRVRRARKGALGKHKSSPRSLRSAASGGAPIAIAPARPRRTKSGARKSHDFSRPSALPPLARTITKIVGVVPLPVRILIGALLALALALAVRSRLAARRARLLERQRGQLLKDVGLLQAALLPTVPARLGTVAASAAYSPAEGPGAGGDFYDVFALRDGRVAVIVGDVSGHGRGALPHTALLRFTLRAYLEAGLSPRESLRTAGAVLQHQLDESFATVVVGAYQPRERILVYASAGHPPPLVLGSRQLEPITACSAAPIGVVARTGTRQTVIAVPGGAKLCFHTDGLTEARVGSELFGAERLTSALRDIGTNADASTLLSRVAEETDARPDDMAACILSIDGDTQAPRRLIEELELDAREAHDRPERFLVACGVESLQAAAFVRSASAEAMRVGSVSIQVRFEGGAPSVELRPENVSSLHGAQVRRAAALGAP